MADVSKLNGYAIRGSSDDAATVTKLSAYAIKDAYLPDVEASKLIAYAIRGSSDSALTVAKLAAYVVIERSGSARPCIATIT